MGDSISKPGTQELKYSYKKTKTMTIADKLPHEQ